MVATITTNKNLSKLLTSTFKFDIRRLGNCIRGVTVGVLASGVVDHRFGSKSETIKLVEAANTHLIVIGLIWPGLKLTIYHTRGELAIYYNTDG